MYQQQISPAYGSAMTLYTDCGIQTSALFSMPK